jgi:hypothetical protein
MSKKIGIKIIINNIFNFKLFEIDLVEYLFQFIFCKSNIHKIFIKNFEKLFIYRENENHSKYVNFLQSRSLKKNIT